MRMLVSFSSSAGRAILVSSNLGSTLTTFFEFAGRIGVVFACFLPAIVVHAQILVRSDGTGILTFDSAPVASEWATYSVPGGSDTVSTAAQMDAAVQLLSADMITGTITPSLTTPPSQNAFARWNQRDRLIQTKPAGNELTVFIARLANATSSDISELAMGYSMGANSVNITQPEPVPGYRVYFSTSGQAGSWQVIPTLCTANPGTLNAVLPLGLWPPGAPLYLLWADDNWITEGDAGYSIDNFMAFVPRTNFLVAVGAEGTETNSFESFLSPTNGWSTTGIPGTAQSYTNAAQLDAGVQAYSAEMIQEPLWKEYTAPADNDGGNNRASQNLQLFTLQSRPSGNAANLLLATLKNGTGSNVVAVRLRYRFVVASSNATENVPGLRVFFSLTGRPGTWQSINSLWTSNTVSVNHLLEVRDWRVGSLLFLLWADDNGPFGTSGTGPREGAYTIDDFSVTPVPPSMVPPRLIIERIPSTAAVELMWADYVNGFNVEYTGEAGSSGWMRLFIEPQTYGGYHHLIFTSANPSQNYYRLVAD